MAPKTLQDFTGRWHVQREIDDRKAGAVVMAEGWAEFSPDADGLTYQEELLITLDGHAPMKATRKYLWRAIEDETVAVHFEDGRYFHQLNLGHEASRDHHACDPDSYSAQYDFRPWPIWSVGWRVVGPRKDYLMHSRFSRAD